MKILFKKIYQTRKVFAILLAFIVFLIFIWHFFGQYLYKTKATQETATLSFTNQSIEFKQNETKTIPFTLTTTNNAKISAVNLYLKFNLQNQDLIEYQSFSITPNNYFDDVIKQETLVSSSYGGSKILHLVLVSKKPDDELSNSLVFNLNFKAKKNEGSTSISLHASTGDIQNQIVGPIPGYVFDFRVANDTTNITVDNQEYCSNINDCGSSASCNNNSCVCNSGYYNCDGNWQNGCESNQACANPTNTPTPTPIRTPTSTPPQGQPTNTPTETPTQPAVSLSLNLKLKFQGISAKPANGLNKIGVTVTVAKDNNKEILNNIIFTANESGIWTSNAPMLFSQIPPGTGYYILVKGGKHLQKKICDNNPSESYPGTYHCDRGKITLSDGDNTLDFSKIVLLAGDLPQQDGIVNSYDTSLVRNNLGKTDTHAISLADINLDGVVDTQDYSLIIAALSIRTDEGESTGTHVNLPTTVSPTLINTAPTTQPSLTVTPSGSGGGNSGASGDLLRDGSTYPVYVSISFVRCNQVTSPVNSISLSLLGQSKSYNNVPLTYETLKITRPLLIGPVNINDFLAQDLHRNDTEVHFGTNANLGVQATGMSNYLKNLNEAEFWSISWCKAESGCIVSYPELEDKKFIYIDQIRVCY